MRLPDRIGDEHLVAGVENRLQGAVVGVNRAVAGEDFRAGIERRAVSGPQARGDRFAQERHPPAVTVVGQAVAHRLKRHCDDLRRRGEVRVARLQGDDVHAAGFEPAHAVGKGNREQFAERGDALIEVEQFVLRQFISP